ncbi:MAG: A/G-specific adenine glycosylase [Elusimicrobiaceae bacterium]|nr:A/G-specific adenine glycosylase [Elusimicrobiaceae bacterium]
MKSIAASLLKWYQKNKRNLPWRHTQDPYKIWLCEIIMQQTRVAQGLSYYNKFVETFPTPRALAAATQDQVLKLWQGLGYYSRARNLHAAAQSMHGKFPTTYEGVRALKGVGDYTAAAICSIAYNMPYAVVDGNVYRVLSRVFGITTPIDSTEGKKQFTALAQELLDKKNPGDYNQAIMDLGALVCTPQAPACLTCPLAKICEARKNGTQEKLPVKAQKTKVSTRYFHYIYVEQGKFSWLHRRGPGDVWQNLYELPLVELPDGHLTAKHPQLKKWFGTAKVAAVSQTPLKHVLSHQIIYAYVYKVKLPAARKVPDEFIQIPATALPKYAVSRLVQKLVEKI